MYLSTTNVVITTDTPVNDRGTHELMYLALTICVSINKMIL